MEYVGQSEYQVYFLDKLYEGLNDNEVKKLVDCGVLECKKDLETSTKLWFTKDGMRNGYPTTFYFNLVDKEIEKKISEGINESIDFFLDSKFECDVIHEIEEQIEYSLETNLRLQLLENAFKENVIILKSIKKEFDLEIEPITPMWYLVKSNIDKYIYCDHENDRFTVFTPLNEIKDFERHCKTKEDFEGIKLAITKCKINWLRAEIEQEREQLNSTPKELAPVEPREENETSKTNQKTQFVILQKLGFFDLDFFKQVTLNTKQKGEFMAKLLNMNVDNAKDYLENIYYTTGNTTKKSPYNQTSIKQAKEILSLIGIDLDL